MRAIERVPLIDEVVGEIRRWLESGSHRVGEKLATERELSESLGVSRSTIREALRVLQALGFIEIKQGRGAFVRRTGEDSDAAIRDWFAQHEFQLLDVMETRAALEPLAVRLAVERATEEEIARIREVLAVFESELAKGDALGLAASDEALHTAIAEASHNNLIRAMDRVLVAALREYRLRSFAVKKNARNALEPHRSIVRAIEDRDANGAMAEMVHHLEISRRDIHQVVDAAERPS